MDNSLAAGRRLATMVVLAQAAAAILAGMLFLVVRGAPSALSALGGGGVVTLGTALLALRVFTPPLARGAVTMRRFALGTLLKWLVVLGGLFVILVRLRWPPLPALVGAGMAMLVNWLVLRFDV